MSRFRSFSIWDSLRLLPWAWPELSDWPRFRSTGLALGGNALRLRRVADLRLVAVEPVAELDAEAPEGPLHAVGHGRP